jgi:hypothetical protein
MAIATARSAIDLRKSQRYPTHIDGTILFRGVPYSIVIADISMEGAMVRGLPLLAPGLKLIVQARSLDVVAFVVHSTTRGVGVRFQSAVNPLDVVRQNYAGLEHLRRPAAPSAASRPVALHRAAATRA